MYNTRDFDRTLVIDDRTRLVAKKVSDFLKESGDRFQKTIISPGNVLKINGGP
jgi:type I restriction enzyme R subunit